MQVNKIHLRARFLSWEGFYKGVGQSLLYLKYGIQRSVLVLGFYKNVPDDQLIDNFKAELLDEKDLLQQILGPYIAVGLLLYEYGTPHYIFESRSIFYHSTEESKLFHNALLQKKFKYDKRLLKNR